MKILLTGGTGQLGHDLQKSAPENVVIYAPSSDELDVSKLEHIQAAIKQFSPDVVINSAAYTAVDKAETEQDKAYAINAKGPENIALALKGASCRLVHISTDFVFDGTSCRPYDVQDKICPLSVYGNTKAKGEEAVMAHLKGSAIIIRTSWVYSGHGNNFVKTMLRLMGEKDNLNIVSDQVGTPTWAYNLASAIWELLDTKDSFGIWHWSDLGIASWYDFAVAIQEEAVELGLLERKIPLLPIKTTDYPTAAIRPQYSVLGTADIRSHIGINGEHWRSALRHMMKELKEFSYD